LGCRLVSLSTTSWLWVDHQYSTQCEQSFDGDSESCSSRPHWPDREISFGWGSMAV